MRTWEREGNTSCPSVHIHSTRENVHTTAVTQHRAPSGSAGWPQDQRQVPTSVDASLPLDPLCMWALHPRVKQPWIINSMQDPWVVRARNSEPQMLVEGTLTVNWRQMEDKPRVRGVIRSWVWALRQRPGPPAGSCFSCPPGDRLGARSSAAPSTSCLISCSFSPRPLLPSFPYRPLNLDSSSRSWLTQGFGPSPGWHPAPHSRITCWYQPPHTPGLGAPGTPWDLLEGFKQLLL